MQCHTASIFRGEEKDNQQDAGLAEDWGSTLLRNVGELIPDYAVSYPRK
jgi:hypothetical protein